MNWFKKMCYKLRSIFKPTTPKKIIPSPVKPIEHGFTPSKYVNHYRTLYNTMVIDKEKLSIVRWYANYINKNIERYEHVSLITGVPSEVIGCLHLMETSGFFHKVLHNGETLINVNKYGTRKVPKRRGKNMNWTWEEAAIDALSIKTQPKRWNIENTLYYCEKFNGHGHLEDPNKPPSPYIWGLTNHHTKGKYVRDHVYDPNAITDQAGIAAQLKLLGFKFES